MKHNALLDCELLREVYITLEVKEPKFNLSSNNTDQQIFKNKSYNKAVVEISDNEINLHKNFLKRKSKKFLLNLFEL